MNRRRFAVLAVLGTVAVAGAVWVAVRNPAEAPWDGPEGVGALVILAGVGLALAKLFGDSDDGDVAPPPWTGRGALADGQPESTPDDVTVSGTLLADYVRTAVERARDGETVEEALASVRRPLRDALVPALVAGGRDHDEVQAALAEGTWTDDPVAASVLDARVLPPPQSLRQRLWTWLFPERAIRDRTTRAVGAVAEAADGALPPVVGQRAPRTDPVATPGLEDLQRAADGTLQRAEGAFTDGRPPTIEESPDGDDARDGADAGGRTDGQAGPPDAGAEVSD